MNALTLSDRSLKQTELSLTTYLAPHFGDLVRHDTVASELGFNPSALGDILAAGLGPEPRPAFNAGCFWFAHWQIPLFWHWVTEQATIQDCSDIAAVMFRHDPELGEPDGDYVRENLLEALCEARGHTDYSTRFRLFLGWQVLLTEAEKHAALERLLASPGPPWRPIPSRDIKIFVGASFQSLANWRNRGTGPPPEPMEKGLGNRIYYRPDRVMAWLSGARHAWEYCADWLAAHGVGVDDPSEASVQDRIDLLERLRVFD